MDAFLCQQCASVKPRPFFGSKSLGSWQDLKRGCGAAMRRLANRRPLFSSLQTSGLSNQAATRLGLTPN